MAGRDFSLYTMMLYQLGWVDRDGTATTPNDRERIRGSLCILSAISYGGCIESSIKHATAVEFIHNYSIIHSDIQEGIPDRDGRPTLWSIWGPAQGINAGDGMHALARLSLFDLHKTGVSSENIARALRYLDTASLSLCEGTYLDTVFQDAITVKEADYLDMSRSLVGALVSASMKLGALAAGVGEGRSLEALALFGENLGIAFKLAEDYSAFWSKVDRNEVLQGRLLAKKKTFPVVHILAGENDADKREIGRSYSQRVLTPESVVRITEILNERGVREITWSLIEDTLSSAKAALDDADLDSRARSDIEAVADYTVSLLSG